MLSKKTVVPRMQRTWKFVSLLCSRASEALALETGRVQSIIVGSIQCQGHEC